MLGTDDAVADEFLQRKIVLSNQLGALGGLVGGIAILITNLASTVGTAPPTIFAIVYIACIPLFNWFGWVRFSRLSFAAVGPLAFLAGTLYLKMTVPDAHSIVYYLLPRFTILASLVSAAIVLDIRNPWEIGIGLLVNGLCLVFFDVIHRWFGLGIETADLTLHNYNMVTVLSVAAFVFLAAGYLFLQRINIRHELHVLGLYEQMKVTNNELSISEEENKQNAEELRAINDRLLLQHETVQQQSAIISQRNNALLDSMTYARRLQKGFVSKRKVLDKLFPKNFVLDIPRDIVSGDYYLSAKMNGWKVLAICDCTGHGTAAALMTMVSHTLLQEAYYMLEEFWPHEILHKLDKGLIEALEGQKIYDGMDIGLLGIHPQWGMRYAGAHIPLYYLDNKREMHIQKGAPFAIGYALHNRKKEFRTHEIASTNIVACYLASDGFQDQFDAKDQRRLYSSNFRELLIQNSIIPIDQQQDILYQQYQEWRGNNRQFDDILVIGIQLEDEADE